MITQNQFKMENLSIKIISRMCRLCLSSNGTIDVFSYSSEFQCLIADAITKCTSVHVEKYSELPTTICEPCYMQLIKTQNFQMLALKSDNTLQLYLQQLQDGDKQNTLGVILPDIDVNYCLETNLANQDTEDNSEEMKDVVKYPESDCEEPKMDTVENKVLVIDSKLRTQWDDHSCNEDSTFNPNLIVKAEPIINDKEDQFDIDNEVLNDFVVNQKNNKSGNEESNDEKMVSSYQCDVCNKCFNVSSDLSNHQSVHTGEKPYKCNFCNTSCSSLSNMNAHKRLHTGEKPYQCDVCNKCFSESSTLKVHYRIHSGDKPYKCNFCDKSFSSLSNMTSHKRIHTGEKPYQCDVCNKSFSQLNNLRTHQRIHTGEKPYQCDVCNKCFSHLSSLIRHKPLHLSSV